MPSELVPGSKEFNRRNVRRFELIQKRVRHGLTAEEEAEFQQLQAEIVQVTRERFPLPTGFRTQPDARAATEHLDYLRRLTADGVVSPDLADMARAVWPDGASELPLPAAAAFSGGPIEYYWDTGPHQLLAEVTTDGRCQWTYRNRVTGEVRGAEAPADVGVPDELKPILERFLGQAVRT